MKIATGLTLGLLLCAAACSTPSAPEYNILPAYLHEVSRGWNFFSQDEFGLAAASFRNAVDLDVKMEHVEAHIGLGWSLAMEDSLQKAILNFELALSKIPQTRKDSLFILSGLSFAYRDNTPPNFTKVRDYALAVLSMDPGFVFDYKQSINVQDLNAVLAEAYFNLGQYTEAAAIADPAGSLDPAAQDFQEKLLAKINQLITISREGV
jgi:tetratricopeptide (TPR) repeat protein